MIQKRLLIVCLLLALFPIIVCGKNISTLHVAEQSLRKAINSTDLGLYPGTLLMHGMSELSLIAQDTELLSETVKLFEKYKIKEIEGRGSYISYEAGGSGAAYLVWKQKAPSLSEQVLDAATRMMAEQKRSSEGLLVPPWAKEDKDQVFIDMAFAVTPYLLYTGLHYQQPEQVETAIFETTELFKILKDNNSGLLHQARGFNGKDKNIVSDDNWSRGNGWGAFALAILVRDLPENHPQKSAINSLAKDYFTQVIRFQDKNGMWHQEMTDFSSYVETSGTGLLLYGIGILLEKGVLESSYRENFLKGLQGYAAYIAKDGSVSNTTIGCLSPRNGTKDDYINRPWAFNDHHAFGPVVLAYTQAYKMGITHIRPNKKQGYYAVPDTLYSKTPKSYVRYVHQRKEDIAWENDKIAFRVFGPPVKDQVGSGIDVWPKSVKYPIIDKWYKLNANGKNYHTDRGEGCDFYDMGYFRGCGGSSVWKNGKPYSSQTYSNHRILKNDAQEIIFELTYAPFEAGGTTITERKTIRMKKGSNLFQVTNTFESTDNEDLTIGIGLTSFGHPQVSNDRNIGMLACWEQIDPNHGYLGTAVLANPKNIIDFAEYEKDRFVLIKTKSGVPVVYYVGAGWDGNPDFKSETDWLKYLRKEAGRLF